MLVSLVLLFGLCLWFWFNWRYYYWKRNGIPGPEPTWVVGNMGPALRMEKQFGGIMMDCYRQFSDFSYCGYFKCLRPAILVRDPAIVNDIMIRDFQHFSSNEFELNKKADPLFALNPFLLQGDHWKHSRSLFSPIFTLNKMRTMFPLILNSCAKLEKYIKSNDAAHDYESKELAAKFTTDNAVMCGFSIDAESFTNPYSDFRKLGRIVFEEASTPNVIKMILVKILPSLLKLFPVPPFVTPETDVWFRKVVLDNLESRKNVKLQHEDFLEMLLQTMDKHGPTFSDRELEITANSLIFFLEGFETSSAVLSFALFELAKHQAEQNALYNEINRVLAQNQLSIDTIQQMDYLDQVLSETMRMHPVIIVLNKVCTQDYELPPLLGQVKGFVIPKGMPVTIPLYPLQNDEIYFRNPEKFDPNRFSDGERINITKGAYFPFGDGPRLCVGMRFGQTQIKAALVTIIKKYRVTLSPKCNDTIGFDPKSFLNQRSSPILLNFTRRGEETVNIF